MLAKRNIPGQRMIKMGRLIVSGAVLVNGIMMNAINNAKLDETMEIIPPIEVRNFDFMKTPFAVFTSIGRKRTVEFNSSYS